MWKLESEMFTVPEIAEIGYKKFEIDTEDTEAFQKQIRKVIEEKIKNWWNDEALTKLIHPYIKEDSEGFNFDFFYEKDIDNYIILSGYRKYYVNSKHSEKLIEAHSAEEYKEAVEGIDLTRFAPPLEKPGLARSVHF